MRWSRTRTVVAALAATAVAAVVGVGGAGPATADGGTTLLRSWNNGLCLDGSSDARVFAQGCNHGVLQRWTLADPAQPAPGVVWQTPPQDPAAWAVYGPWWLRNEATGRCLDSNWAGDMYMNECQAGNAWQLWVEWRWGQDDKAHTFVNFHTGRAVQIEGNGVTRTQAFVNFAHDVRQDLKRGF